MPTRDRSRVGQQGLESIYINITPPPNSSNCPPLTSSSLYITHSTILPLYNYICKFYSASLPPPTVVHTLVQPWMQCSIAVGTVGERAAKIWSQMEAWSEKDKAQLQEVNWRYYLDRFWVLWYFNITAKYHLSKVPRASCIGKPSKEKMFLEVSSICYCLLCGRGWRSVTWLF